MKYKLIIFDWDGTVMDSVPKIVSTMQLAAQELALTVPSTNDVKNIIGLSLEKAAEQLFGSSIDTSLVAKSYKQIYSERDTTPAPLFDKVYETLQALKGAGYTLAVATGKSRTGLDRLLVETELVNLFSYTRTACECESKPHPDMLYQLLEMANVDASEALMIGDTIIDMTLANNAGVDALAVTFGVHDKNQLKALSPLTFVDHFSDIKTFLMPSA